MSPACAQPQEMRVNKADNRLLALLIATVFTLLIALMFATPRAMADTTNLEPFMGGKATSEQFPSPQGCSCHSDFLDQWGQSMHAQSLTDPFYKLQTDQVDKTAGKEVSAFCDTCHAPAAMMSGGIQTAQTNDALNGITCTVCHQVTAQHAERPGNASLAYPKGGPDGVLHAQLMDPKAPHQASGNELYSKSEYCGACHNVSHPANGLKLETTYDEWQQTAFAKQGVECQNCHMSPNTSLAPQKGSAAMGAPERDKLFSMTFVGANVAQGNEELSKALLQKAAKVEITPANDIVPAGQEGNVTVSVTNVGAGHSIPTGLTEVRHMWLTISAVDANGKKTEVGRTEFGTSLTDDSGKEVGAQFWLASKHKSDLRIKAGETFKQEVKVTMPQSVQKQELVAELNYQSAKDEVIKGSGVDNPTTTMASAKSALYPTQAAKDADAKAQPTKTDNKPAQEDEEKGFWPAIIVSAVILVTAIVVLVIIRKRKK